MNVWFREVAPRQAHGILAARDNSRALEATNRLGGGRGPRRQRRAHVGGGAAGKGDGRAVVAALARDGVGGARQLAVAVLLEELPAQRGALEDRLDQVILLERLGEVLVHLRLDATLAVAHHGVGREGDDGGALGAEAALVLADLGRGLETTL